MKLSKVHIKNFRSINEAIINIDKNCIVLLGKNEAGKSNILKAIASLFNEYKITASDKRKRINNEAIEEYFIKGTFSLTTENLNKIMTDSKDIVDIFFSESSNWIPLEKHHFIEDINKEEVYYLITHKLEELFNNIIINKNIIANTIELLIINKDAQVVLCDDINYPSLCNEGYKHIFNDIKSFFQFANLYNEKHFDDLCQNLSNNAVANIANFYTDIKCHYWSYKAEYMLPNSIIIDKFINDPNYCKPLKNIFCACKRSEIRKEFDDALKENGDYIDLLDQVSNGITQIFQNIWVDFKNTKIELFKDGNNILIKIKNEARYSFEDRSDGFKKFICILLMLSTQSRANIINENDIILIDEPDQSLYPTSARYLRDELLEISKNSLIIYTTHSQYMIDSNCIDRHFIIEKKNDISFINNNRKNSPFSNDELLRNAIGTSIFECIKNRNIIFEGWLDKELFVKYCKYNNLDKFKDVGITYLGGISGVNSIVQIMMLAKKDFVIVADSDKESKKKKKDFVETYKEYSNSWIGYEDICENISTMEDFLVNDYIETVIQTRTKKDFKYNDENSAIENISNAFPDKAEKQNIKNNLIENLEKCHIKDTYNGLITILEEKLLGTV